MKTIDLSNIEEPIQRLQTILKTNGHIYKLHTRNEFVALYEQYSVDTGQLVGYELTEILIRPEEVIKGVTYKKRECYCSGSLWGESGFSLMLNSSEEYLEKRFKEFTDKVKNKRN